MVYQAANFVQGAERRKVGKRLGVRCQVGAEEPFVALCGARLAAAGQFARVRIKGTGHETHQMRSRYSLLRVYCQAPSPLPAPRHNGIWAGSSGPEGNFHTQNHYRFAEAVLEATDGEVVINLHPGGALGLAGPELLAAVRDQIVPIADILLNQQVGEEPIFGMESLPYLAPSFDDLELLQSQGACALRRGCRAQQPEEFSTRFPGPARPSTPVSRSRRSMI